MVLKTTVMKKKKFPNVRGDIIKTKRFTDIELDTIDAGVTLSNLMGFDYDPSDAHEEQTAYKTSTKMLLPP